MANYKKVCFHHIWKPSREERDPLIHRGTDFLASWLLSSITLVLVYVVCCAIMTKDSALTRPMFRGRNFELGSIPSFLLGTNIAR